MKKLHKFERKNYRKAGESFKDDEKDTGGKGSDKCSTKELRYICF
jgi:hypothetical protein